MTESMFTQAVGLARSGRKHEARDLFRQILRVDRTNEMAWLWYADCVDTLTERVQALETCARLNPQARRVRMALSVLQRGRPPSADLGRTQPVFIRRDEPEEEKKGLPPLSPEDEWVLSAGSAVFTVPPDSVSPDEFARIEESTAAFLMNNPDIKPFFRRAEYWSEKNSKPAAAREPRSNLHPQALRIPNTGSSNGKPRS
jgi:hypothetical protein